MLALSQNICYFQYHSVQTFFVSITISLRSYKLFRFRSRSKRNLNHNIKDASELQRFYFCNSGSWQSLFYPQPVCSYIFFCFHILGVLSSSIIFLGFCWPCHRTCGILVPQAGVELWPLSVKASSANCWINREFSYLFLSFFQIFIHLLGCAWP